MLFISILSFNLMLIIMILYCRCRLQMIELLKEQTYHCSVIDTTVSQQSMTQSLDSSDTMVDMTVDDMNLTQRRQSDNVPPHQMMFSHAMDEVECLVFILFRNNYFKSSSIVKIDLCITIYIKHCPGF